MGASASIINADNSPKRITPKVTNCIKLITANSSNLKITHNLLLMADRIYVLIILNFLFKIVFLV